MKNLKKVYKYVMLLYNENIFYVIIPTFIKWQYLKVFGVCLARIRGINKGDLKIQAGVMWDTLTS